MRKGSHSSLERGDAATSASKLSNDETGGPSNGSAPNPEYGRTYRCTNVSFLEETHARAIGKLSFGVGPSWPPLDRGTINVKSLHQPSAYVISLSEAAPRRKVFADQWRNLDFDVPISWVSATNARDIDAVTVE